MPNTPVRAAAEGMPAINRRRMLLGLAAASTAAATVSVAAASAPAENPELLRLAAELPAIAKAHHVARLAYKHMEKKWERATPWAPDELTERGTAWPISEEGRINKQPGDAELKALGGYLWREGDDFPRRIVVKARDVRWDIRAAKSDLRKAKKAGSVADCLRAKDEIERLEQLLATAEAYETKFAKVRKQALADHERLWPAKAACQEALERHIAAIMKEKDFTMEGLVIKAQALAEWDRSDNGAWKVPFKYGQDWPGQIATSILRHAGGAQS